MRRKKKIKERLEAWLLAVVFFMQAVCGLLPVRDAQAAVTAIQEWDERELMDYRYRFNVKFQPGITRAEPFGCDNKDWEAFTNHGRNRVLPAVTRRLTDTYESESAGIRYYNVGKDSAGNIVDLKMSLVSAKSAKPRYDLYTPSLKYKQWHDGEEDLGYGFDWKNNMAQPVVAFTTETIGVYLNCVGTARLRFQLYKHNTDEPLAISGHGTVQDIDSSQGVILPSNSGMDFAYILKGNQHLTVDGTSVQADDENIASGDKRGWLNFLYQSDHFSLSCTYQALFERWDRIREEEIAARGSVEKWAQSRRNAFVDPDGNSYCENYNGEIYTQGYAYFDFTSYGFGGIEMKKDPEKRVGNAGCSWEEAAAAKKAEPFPIQGYEEFQYLVQAELTPNKLEAFSVQDTLEDCLTIDGPGKVSVRNDAGQDVTEQFKISISGQTITCEARSKYLSKESFTDNQTYTFVFQVHRKEKADVSAWLTKDGYTFLVPNQAEMSYMRDNGSGETKTTGKVWVTGLMGAELAVKKTASRYEWMPGDEIEYTVRVTQTNPNAHAVNVVLEDLDIPPCLQLVSGKYFLQADSGVENCSVTEDGANGWRAFCPKLGPGESMEVTFYCLALEESNGQEWVNTVCATADNFLDPVTGEKKTVKDLAEVWPNKAQLTIDKSADKYEWAVGDEVVYRLVVTNTVPGSVARDVNICDFGLPEGLILPGGAASVEVLQMPGQIEYPVADHKTGQATELRDVDFSVEGDEYGFSFYCSCLPYSYPVTLLLHCIATEAANGREAVNEASARAANAMEETADDGEIYVNTGNFRIEKTADHYEWQVGEQVEYQVVVENQAAGTIARNVTIWDTSMPQGLALAGEDAVNISGIPEEITVPVAGTPDIPGQLNPEYYGETAQKIVASEFFTEGSGWRLNLSDLPAGMPVYITFLCTVMEEANGMESINAAYVQAENAGEQGDDAEIYVNTAALQIEKSVNNPYMELGDGRAPNEFRVGEQVEYQVVVNNLQKGSIARNLVIRDLALPEGLALDGDENAIGVYGIPEVILNPVPGFDDEGNVLNPENYNEVEEKTVDYQLVREGTGWTLTISDLPYDMPVTVVFRCTATEEVNGMEVVNTASAIADNAAEVQDTAKIWVNTPVLLVEKKADKQEYKYGDIITYQICLSQEQTGCVARNVVVDDVFETAGVRLLKDSVVLLNQDGDRVDAQVEAGDDNTFTVYTGRPLIKEEGYFICDTAQGGVFQQVLFNPLDCRTEKKMTIEYQAAVIDESLAGQQVRNVATADSPEGEPSYDDENVEIHSPILDITKESDKKEYRVGDTAYYKLVVRQLREDVTADNLVIEDIMDNGYAQIQMDSILVRKNSQPLENAVVEGDGNRFFITTGTSLSDADKLEVFYKVLFAEASPESMTVVNAARAWGDNTPEVPTQHEIYVENPPKPTPTPKPTAAPEPTATPRPTKTPAPTKIPTPTPGTCPKCTPLPTKVPSYGGSGNQSGGNTSDGNRGNNGTYGSNYGNSSPGMTASNAKTGDTRPFRVMVVIGALGGLLLVCGTWLYRKTKKKGRTCE